jgi:hypothetical protein
MPWSLQNRDGKWCVVKQGAADPVPGGCHPDRASAIKHQRALYANEARVASMYAELDAQDYPEPVLTPTVTEPPATSPVMAEILALLARDQQEKSLVASVAEHQNLISQQFQEAAAERQALVAALGRMGSPTINLPPSEINISVPPADVMVTVPPAEVNVTVEQPAINLPAPQITVQPSDVTVTLPERTKTVTFERDPLTHEVTSAEVTET